MGKITINEIHKSLFDYIQAVSDESLETKDKTIVGAINELIQNSNSNKTEINNLTNEISNGKQLIANAIGSPLSSDDTFAAMGNEINQMTIDFRNALAVKGVNAPADKMERLIERIDEIIQSGNVLNIQTMVSGEYTLTQKFGKDGVSTLTVPLNLDFEPDYFVICIPKLTQKSGNELHPSYAVLTPEYPTVEYFQTYMSASSVTYYNVKLVSYDSTSCVLKHASEVGYVASGTVLKWYAIGVREEDTTLSGGLDIISATELPATGRENQICVISENPVDKFLVSSLDSDFSNLPNDTILLQTKYESTTHNYTVNNGNVISKYYISSCVQEDSIIPSYVYTSGQWVELTPGRLYFVKNKQIITNTEFGTIYKPSIPYVNITGDGISFYSLNTTNGVAATVTNKINLSAFRRIHIVARVSSGNLSTKYIGVYSTSSKENKSLGSSSYPAGYVKVTQQRFTSTEYADGNVNYYRQEFDFDITDWTGEYYLGFYFQCNDSSELSMYIEEIYFY